MRPWVVLWEHRSTKIFCYPIARPPRRAPRRPRSRASTRRSATRGGLKLLRRLSDGPLKLSEAAAELGVAKSTAHHHLAILRQAGFVDDARRGRKVYTSAATCPQAGELLSAYLGSSRSSSTERVEDAVHPAVAAAVRLPLDALADPAGALRVPLRPLVEAVDLELDPVEAELADQVALQQAGGVVGEPAAAEARMHGDAAGVGDPAAAVLALPRHRAGALAAVLDDRAAPPASGSSSARAIRSAIPSRS